MFRLIATLLRPRNSFELRKRLTSAFLVRFTATFLSRFTAKFLLRSTEAFRSRAVAAVVDAGRVVGVFTSTSPLARNSCEFLSLLARFCSRTVAGVADA